MNREEVSQELRQNMMDQKGTTFDQDFYVFVGKQCRLVRTRVPTTISLYKLTNVFFII